MKTHRLYCRAGRDGDCTWEHCPQHIEYRGHCPLDVLHSIYHDEDGFFKSPRHEAAWSAIAPAELGGER